ncbi:MAG: DNA mismatch repair endonuclease MutL [Ignavibacteriae bacterium]|nr:DNA mismatch repair endonuclease MutL [Ignavibacteriota bacterium]
MNNRIHILPEYIANQIAAGEVVQRPESVVKELVENSMDAGAEQISVVVRGSGKQLIHINDNGSGMSRDDLALSTKRHATSKIQTVQDLERIMTLGFRGEALASIGAVAHLEIRTRRQEDEIGWKLTAEPLKDDAIEPFKSEKGTQIFVRNLFFNVPARKKFLRSDLTEFRHISETMLKFSLARPDIRFTFYDADSLIFDVKPSTLEQRIVALMGERSASQLIPVEFTALLAKVSGFVGQPSMAKQSRSGQYFFLNGRAITNRALTHAVFFPFEHLLDKNSHPFFVLNIEIDAEKVDVNVHPQKHEVKFDDERMVYNTIQQAVAEALQRSNLVREAHFREQVAEAPFEKVQLSPSSTPNDILLVNRLTGEIINSSMQERQPAKVSENNPQSSSQSTSKTSHLSLEYKTSQKQTFGIAQQTAFDALFGTSTSIAQNHEPEKEQLFESPQVQMTVWQLHNKYVFVQTDKGVMVIDQHNAHERILYERALKAMNEQFANGQKLLFPVKVLLNSSEKALFDELSADLERLGFDITINDGIAEVRGVPLDVHAGEEEQALKEILSQYEEFQQIRHSDSRDNLAASFGCKAAIKTGQRLSESEMRKLVEDLFATSTPYVCPHGRPVVIDFPLGEFDRRFGRTS